MISNSAIIRELMELIVAGRFTIIGFMRLNSHRMINKISPNLVLPKPTTLVIIQKKT